MILPEEDVTYMTEKGYRWSLLPGGDASCLVLQDYVLGPVFDRDRSDVMIRIPAGYNLAALDMFYVDPPVRLKTSGAYPQAADHFEEHAGRRWQRFSRHLPAPWRPGIDGLPMFLALVGKELKSA